MAKITLKSSKKSPKPPTEALETVDGQIDTQVTPEEQEAPEVPQHIIIEYGNQFRVTSFNEEKYTANIYMEHPDYHIWVTRILAAGSCGATLPFNEIPLVWMGVKIANLQIPADNVGQLQAILELPQVPQKFVETGEVAVWYQHPDVRVFVQTLLDLGSKGASPLAGHINVLAGNVCTAFFTIKAEQAPKEDGYIRLIGVVPVEAPVVEEEIVIPVTEEIALPATDVTPEQTAEVVSVAETIVTAELEGIQLDSSVVG